MSTIAEELPRPAWDRVRAILKAHGYCDTSSLFLLSLLFSEMRWLGHNGDFRFDLSYADPEHPSACMDLTHAGLMSGVVFINEENFDEVRQQLDEALSGQPVHRTVN